MKSLRHRLLRNSALLLLPAALYAQTSISDVKQPNEPQNLDLYLPKILPEHEGRVIDKYDEPAIPDAESRPIINELKGIVFRKDKEAIDADGIYDKGIHIDLPILDTAEFRTLIYPWLGEELSLDDLNKIVRATVLYMREQNRPVVDAIIPQQNISTGTVQILVLIGKLGNLSTENNKYFESDLIKKYIRHNRGALIDGVTLMEDLRWINQNPFRQVDLVYAAGDNFGETDIILRTIDRLPLRVYGGYENTGTNLTGMDRWIAGLNWGNAFNLDHLLNYQFTTSKDGESLQAHSFSYFIPLPWRHKLWTFGSYSLSSARLPDPLELKGESWRISNRYIIPFTNIKKYEHELTIGYDFINSSSELFFNKERASDINTNIIQSILSYGGSMKDKYGFTDFTTSLMYSPGGLNSANKTESFELSRAGAKADYLFTRLEVERVNKLPKDFLHLLRLHTQYTKQNLLSSEQMNLGGFNTVRGYENSEATVDKGFIMNNEIHTPDISDIILFFNKKYKDNLSLIVFWDYANGENNILAEDEDPHIVMSSVGPGLRYSIASHMSARLDYGFQLKDSGNSPTGENKRLDISVVFSY